MYQRIDLSTYQPINMTTPGLQSPVNPAPKTWLITGTSTGLGRALAESVIASGNNLIATARNRDKIAFLQELAPDRVLTVGMEITRQEEVDNLVREATARFGRIDVLVNNAGYGLQGAIEETSDAEARHQFDVNVFGLLAVTRAVLPLLRQQRSGHILNLSSQAGVMATPGLGIYAATKFAVEAISESLAAELKPFGIRVTSIQPGPFRTDWAGGNMVHTAIRMDEYAESSGATAELLTRINGAQPGDPMKAARAMMAIVEAENPPLRLPLGSSAVDRIRNKMRTVAKELTAWETLALDTGF
jgi:short-subunit dehydrogenase